MEHVITAGDLMIAAGVIAAAVVVVVGLAIAAAEFGWLDR